jgi:AcrR family transcriptional regulator
MVETTDKRSTLERILEAASRVFAREGYQGASMTAVAAEAGLTKPTIYNHFENKEALYQAMLIHVHEKMEHEVAAAAAAHVSSHDKLQAAVEASVHLSRKYSDLIRLVHTIFFLPEALRPRLDLKHFPNLKNGTLYRLVAEGVEHGELQGDPLDITLVISGVLGMIAFSRHLPRELQVGGEGMERRIFEVIYRGARREQAPGSDAEVAKK